MKWKIIFILMLFIIPLQVKGESLYFNHGEYQYSNEVIEEAPNIEVEEIYEGENVVYKYRTRDYLIIPEKIIIDTIDFNIFDHINTNLPIEDIKVTEYYDLKTMNNCDGVIEISYGKTIIGKLVHIRIKDYIKVPTEIIVTDYDFDIFKYIETNIKDESKITITGEYNLHMNGKYELTLSYNEQEEKTIIVVDIEENNVLLEDEEVENPSEEKVDIAPVEDEDDLFPLEKKVIVHKYVYETNNYIDNSYEEYKSNEDSCINENPVNTEVIYKTKEVKDKTFYYVSYAFYSIVIILLSIIVVRKK